MDRFTIYFVCLTLEPVGVEARCGDGIKRNEVTNPRLL